MLEFYPLPTNLNHGAGLYPHHPNHGHAAGRFLDSRAGGPSGPGLNGVNGGVGGGSGSMATSPASSVCSTNSTASCGSGQHHNNNNNNNNNSCSPTSTITASTPSGPATNLGIGVQHQQHQQHLHQQQQQQQHQHQRLMGVGIGGGIVPTATPNGGGASTGGGGVAATPTSSAAPPTLPPPPALTATSTPTTVASSTTLSSTSSSSLSLSSSSSSSSSSLSSSASKSSGDCSGRTEVGHIKCEKNYEICEGCGQKIHDRYLMNVGDTNWHEHCLACCYCGMQLHHTCYVRNAKIYCKLDYERLFSVKCAACCHPVLPQEMVMRPIANYVFHLPCFVCYACRLPLQKGEQFMLRDGQLFCFRHDLEKELYLAAAAAAAAQHCGFVGLDEEDLMRPRDGRRGPKRPRTILTSQQRKQFKASFDQSPKPCRKVREALAKDTGLSVRVVQVWFQNQRAKMKKIQRKAKNSGGNNSTRNGNGNSSGNNDDKDKEKDEKVGGVKQECTGSESGSGSYLNMTDSNAFASQPLNPNLPFSPDDYPANSNDSFCSSADLSLDGSNFDQLDDDGDSLSLNNLDLQSTSSSGHHHHHGHSHGHGHHSHGHHQHSNPHDMIASLNTSLINPIDKLYLMQNSYFNSEP